MDDVIASTGGDRMAMMKELSEQVSSGFVSSSSHRVAMRDEAEVGGGGGGGGGAGVRGNRGFRGDRRRRRRPTPEAHARRRVRRARVARAR